tara:strand:+ start:1571 stop:2446 length:876 start_codon:yes stop_codon:yes gene_type:complete
MEKIKFSKYQGIGNDFIVIDARSNDLITHLGTLNHDYSKLLCHRNFGIGADGIVLILKSDEGYDIKMKIINSDGTEAEMCGNGIRCMIKYLIDNHYQLIDINKDIRVQTLAGLILAKYNTSGQIDVNMGFPIFTPELIPTKLSKGSNGIAEGKIDLFDKSINIYSVSMGNPHLITYIEKLNEIDINKYGPFLENHNLFPSKTNVHFVNIKNRTTLEILVWERGCGPTYACGTGACATVVCSYKLGLCDDKVRVRLKGGFLDISWKGTNSPVHMIGDAKLVYTGIINLTDLI